MEVLTVLVPYILRGLRITLSVTGVALASGLIFGAVLAILRVYGGKWLSKGIALYITVIRALPHARTPRARRDGRSVQGLGPAAQCVFGCQAAA